MSFLRLSNFIILLLVRSGFVAKAHSQTIDRNQKNVYSPIIEKIDERNLHVEKTMGPTSFSNANQIQRASQMPTISPVSPTWPKANPSPDAATLTKTAFPTVSPTKVATTSAESKITHVVLPVLTISFTLARTDSTNNESVEKALTSYVYGILINDKVTVDLETTVQSDTAVDLITVSINGTWSGPRTERPPTESTYLLTFGNTEAGIHLRHAVFQQSGFLISALIVKVNDQTVAVSTYEGFSDNKDNHDHSLEPPSTINDNDGHGTAIIFLTLCVGLVLLTSLVLLIIMFVFARKSRYATETMTSKTAPTVKHILKGHNLEMKTNKSSRSPTPCTEGTDSDQTLVIDNMSVASSSCSDIFEGPPLTRLRPINEVLHTIF